MLSRLELKCRGCKTIQFIGQQYEELSENQYAILAGISRKDIYREDPTPNIVDVTKSTLSILGFKREELVGREVRSLDPLMAKGAYGNLWKLIVARKFQPFSIDVYQPRIDGTFVKAHSRTVFQHTKEATYLMTIFDLIETLPRVPDRLPLPSKTDIGKIFCPFLIEINRDGICDVVSYEFASLLGYLITDIVNQYFLRLYPESLLKKRRKLIFAMMKNRQSFRIIKDMLEGKDATKHTFDAHFTVRYTDHGVFNGLLVALWPAYSSKK